MTPDFSEQTDKPVLQDEHKMKKCVSQKFMEFANYRYPNLINNKAYRKFFLYICFSNWCDDESGQLLIPHSLVAKCCGLDNDTLQKNHKFSSGRFLKEFKQNVLQEIEYVEYQKATDDENSWISLPGRCRTVSNRGLDQPTQRAIQEELMHPEPEDGTYYFASGKKRIAAEVAQERRDSLQEYQEKFQVFKTHLNETQQIILSEMIHTAKNGKGFIAKYHKNKEEIDKAIDKMTLDYDDKISLDDKKIKQRSILASILEEPRVFYALTPLLRTPRLHTTLGDSVVTLHTPVRQALCKGWYEADLVSSQFIILSQYLHAPIACRFIKERAHLWTYLHNEVTGEWTKPDKNEKSKYKNIIYGLCFGMSKNELADRAKKAGISAVLDTKMIQELLYLRTQWFEKIQNNGVIVDIWNNVHKLEKAGTKKDIYGNSVFVKERWQGSLAATKIQSIEMEIIGGAYRAIRDNKENWQVKAMIHQHDGFTLAYYDKNKINAWQEGIQAGVAERAKQVGEKLGIDLSDMRLEFNQL